ncbi:MAG: guanosine-3',5'-bis(diphosphate) 3'-diphosphatase, partial [Xanthomonadales bacterium]|nr:guanosine-3',5'-bis(diphosphate) 3'-diphosphatase [Xanthomonadales bacterium]
GSSVDAIPEQNWKKFLQENHLTRQEDVFHELALGTTLANIVAGKLLPETHPHTDAHDTGEAITIAGSEGNALSFGACCLPVPGDKIMAYVSTDKGLVVHRVSCSNVREFRKHPDRCVDVIWAPITKGMFPVSVRIVTRNTPGVLANVSTSIGEAGSNIETVAQPEANPEIATLLFNISVKDRDHMARVMRRLRRNSNVIRAHRVG